MNEEREPGTVEAPEKSKRSITDFIGLGGAIGIALGAVGGYLYYYYIGCHSGTCPINSNPYISTLWGAIIGYLLGDMFRKKRPKQK